MTLACKREKALRLTTSLLVFLVLLLTAGPGWGLSPAKNLKVLVDRVTFNPTEDLVNVFATVAGEAGRPPTDLSGDDFFVREDGRQFNGSITARPFVVTDRELAYALLVDHNEATTSSLSLIQTSVESFVEEMGFRYYGSLISYVDQAQLVQKPVKDARRLASAVLALEPVSGRPHINDALLLAADALDEASRRASAPLDRRLIIVLTEGEDRGSLFNLTAAATRIKSEDIDVFVVGYGYRQTPTLSALADLARESGGEYFFTPDPDQLKPIMETIALRLKYQYILTYAGDAPAANGKTGRIEAGLKISGTKAEGGLEFIRPEQKGPPDFRLIILVAGCFVSSGILLFLVLSRLWEGRAGRNRPRKRLEP